MVAALYLFVVVPLIIFAIWKILPYVLAIPVLLVGAICKAFVICIKKLIGAVPWGISAICASAFVFYALGRQFFFKEDAKLLIAEKLPPRFDIRQRSFSLLTIELIMVIRELIRKQCDSELV